MVGFHFPWSRKRRAQASDTSSTTEPQHKPIHYTGPLRRVSLRYRGRVQAVGFRYQVEILAQSVGVTGWVRNEDNGDVLLHVQGTPQQIERYKEGIQELSASRNTWIEAALVEEKPLEVVDGERKFSVAYT